MDIESRHRMTFEQAEGRAPLPAQMSLGEISSATTAMLWKALFLELSRARLHSTTYMSPSMFAAVQDEWVQRRHGFVDDVSNVMAQQIKSHRETFSKGDYVDILGMIQFYMRHPGTTDQFTERVEHALASTGSAYRVVDGRTIAPVTSEANAAAVSRDLATVDDAGIASASAHLRAAAEALSSTDFAGSIRESIHAVDAVARTLAPDAHDLGPALSALSARGYIHGAMKQGFSALYGYASNEKGIRHALLDEAAPNVTEADALYMFGACAAFCAYLTSKGREFGLLS